MGETPTRGANEKRDGFCRLFFVAYTTNFEKQMMDIFLLRTVNVLFSQVLNQY
jgi:hypothetical protein